MRYKKIVSGMLFLGVTSVATASPVTGLWDITNTTGSAITEMTFDLTSMDYVFDVITYGMGEAGDPLQNTPGSGQGRPFLQDPADTAGAATAAYTNQVGVGPDLFQTVTLTWGALDPFADGQNLRFLIDTDYIAGLVAGDPMAFDIVMTGADVAGMSVTAGLAGQTPTVNATWVATSGTAGGFNSGGLAGSQAGSSMGNVPEPTSLLLLATGLLGMVGSRARKFK